MMRRSTAGQAMLFDIYFNLGSLYLGICTYFAHTTKAEGVWHAIGIAIGTLIVIIYGRALLWHLRRHAQDKGWRFYRRYLPLLFYVAGYAAPLVLK